MKKTNEVVKEILSKLEEGVKEVYNSEKWREYLIFQSKFKDYSFYNTLLIFRQSPEATNVAGFKTWLELGRVVKKGSKAIKILAPLIKKVENNGEKKPVVYGFRAVSVFDVSQTEGDEIPKMCDELTSNDDKFKHFYNATSEIVSIPISEEEIAGSVKGYFSHKENRIAINKNISAEHKAKTLIHEYAHYILHANKEERLKTTRNIREIEAESTAFVVLNYFGFDTGEYSFPYIAGWNGTKEDIEQIKAAGTKIQKTAKNIIEDIEKVLNTVVKKSA